MENVDHEYDHFKKNETNFEKKTEKPKIKKIESDEVSKKLKKHFKLD